MAKILLIIHFNLTINMAETCLIFGLRKEKQDFLFLNLIKILAIENISCFIHAFNLQCTSIICIY